MVSGQLALTINSGSSLSLRIIRSLKSKLLTITRGNMWKYDRKPTSASEILKEAF